MRSVAKRLTEEEMEAEVGTVPAISKSYSSRVVEFLRNFAIIDPDATFTSSISRDIGLDIRLVTPTLTRLSRKGIIKSVGIIPPNNQIVYQFVDPTVSSDVRSLSMKGFSKASAGRNRDKQQTKLPFIDGENPETQPAIDTLKEAILQADTRDHKSAIKESEMSLPLCREESLVEMLLRFGIAVERYQANPDLSRVSAEALMQEVKKRGLV
jgi:hypothetical protein